MALPGTALAQSSPLPSGQSATLAEVIWETQPDSGELWLRLRFLAPGIAADAVPAVGFEAAAADMQALCDAIAVPVAAADGRRPAVVVVSLADRPLAFGQTDADAVQYFEAFTVQGAACVVEGL